MSSQAAAKELAAGTGAVHEDGPALREAVSITAERDGVRLSVRLAPGRRLIVESAQSAGERTPRERQAMDRLCSIILGRPLQEAADHGAIYLMETQSDLAGPVPGIRLPRNAGPEIALAERLIRAIHAEARKQLGLSHRENAWYPRPADSWLSKTESEKAEAIKPIIADFLKQHALGDGDLWVSRIERGTRITVAFGESVSYREKPDLLMHLERTLRDQTGDPLELFMDEMRDTNRIRRL